MIEIQRQFSRSTTSLDEISCNDVGDLLYPIFMHQLKIAPMFFIITISGDHLRYDYQGVNFSTRPSLCPLPTAPLCAQLSNAKQTTIQSINIALQPLVTLSTNMATSELNSSALTVSLLLSINTRPPGTR
jgi:hypothetical protein